MKKGQPVISGWPNRVEDKAIPFYLPRDSPIPASYSSTGRKNTAKMQFFLVTCAPLGDFLQYGINFGLSDG